MSGRNMEYGSNTITLCVYGLRTLKIVAFCSVNLLALGQHVCALAIAGRAPLRGR